MRYYINTIQNYYGDNELHNENCRYLNNIDNRKYVGLYETDNQAIKEARKKYPSAIGCQFCCCSSVYESECGLMGLYY